MIAYKGFTKDLSARLGSGTFRYEIGKTYEESEANCARDGFHCTEEPLGVLRWYGREDDRYCIVKAEGDIHEDGADRISCSKITIVKELDKRRLALHECKWIQEHPLRKCDARVHNDKAKTNESFVIVRGKRPLAAGKKGALLLLLKEKPKSKEIESIVALEVDGEQIKPNVYYTENGKRARVNDKKRTQKIANA